MNLFNKAQNVIQTAINNNHIILSAESCTAGLIGAALTDCSGASQAYHGGFVVYDNEAKNKFINVPYETLNTYGAVSPECAKAMAQGTIEQYPKGSISIAVTGIAGPGGGSVEKPVGLVYFGCYNKKRNKVTCEKKIFTGDRQQIRDLAVSYALDILLDNLN